MNREVHVRFWEGVKVKLFRATQLLRRRMSAVSGRDINLSKEMV